MIFTDGRQKWDIYQTPPQHFNISYKYIEVHEKPLVTSDKNLSLKFHATEVQ